VLFLFTACSVQPTKPEGSERVRQKLSSLQADSRLASRAQLAIKEAETATRIAEQPEKDQALVDHRVFMADHKVEIAIAIAESRLLEDQREALNEQSERARLDSRTREADAAQNEATRVKQRNAELEQQLIDLNAKKSERGMIVTIGDLLFETGKADLRNGISTNLDKMSSFLNKYQDRQIIIEGYTDNVGSDEFNIQLSQRRADAIKLYLSHQGVAESRMTTAGKGENAPVSSNETALGRQKNRRVEITIVDNEL
jgi:outer membrane protein OmpA-like peptidoglycan-associated protein